MGYLHGRWQGLFTSSTLCLYDYDANPGYIYSVACIFFLKKFRHKFTSNLLIQELSSTQRLKVLATLLGIFYETHNKAEYHCIKEKRVEALNTPHTLTSSVSFKKKKTRPLGEWPPPRFDTKDRSFLFCRVEKRPRIPATQDVPLTARTHPRTCITLQPSVDHTFPIK